MRRHVWLATLALFLACAVEADALRQVALTHEIRQSIDVAVKDAFGHLLSLPRDTDAAKMGDWVVDSAATLADADSNRWTIVVNRLSDTGEGLKLSEEMSRQAAATTPRQLAEAAAAVAQLEKQIGKLEADATLVVTVDINADTIATGSKGAAIAIRGATRATRTTGAWVSDQWHPGSVTIAFAGEKTIRSITVRAQGNDHMIEQVITRSRWEAFTALLNRISSPD